MQRPAVLLFAFLLAACAESEAPKAVSEEGETLYVVRGTILSRSESANTVHMDHDDIPGFMPAMRMDYAVRGAKVADLPPNGQRVEANLHVTQRAYWVTDVKPIP
jgi:protein SCO1/2